MEHIRIGDRVMIAVGEMEDNTDPFNWLMENESPLIVAYINYEKGICRLENCIYDFDLEVVFLYEEY